MIDPEVLRLQDELHAAAIGELVPLRPRLVRSASRRVARAMATFDAEVSTQGVRAAARRYIERCGARLSVRRFQGVPPEGPLLIVANHPGTLDAWALLAAVERDDMRLVTHDQHFVRLFPNLFARTLLAFGSSVAGHRRFLREAIATLRDGGTVALFPSQKIEPEPLCEREAVATVAHWSESPATLARHVDGLRIVPVIISGAVAGGALFHPLRGLFTDPLQRKRWTMYWQLVRRCATDVEVSFGEPVGADDVREAAASVMAEVVARRVSGALRASEWAGAVWGSSLATPSAAPP